MKKYINRNFFWADLIVEQLSLLGLNQVCISPGSRNTPLTMAFASNKKFKKFIHIDERSSAFFALGLAKNSNNPVAIVTTSGTAVAELYPGIIEAYNQRIPLIVLTADRPRYLRNTGANQTINQENIFSNHIRYFADFGLPKLTSKTVKEMINNVVKGVGIAKYFDPGPIHFNIPFKKPLEPNSFSDNITLKQKEFLINKKKIVVKNNQRSESKLVYNRLMKATRPIILVGWDNYSAEFGKKLLSFSQNHNIPILCDGTSSLRFNKSQHSTLIVNHALMLSELEQEPNLILQFGAAPTSNLMLKYLEKTNSPKLLIDQNGDLKDPSRNKGTGIKIIPELLLNELSNRVKTNPAWKKWTQLLSKTDQLIEVSKSKIDDKEIGIEPSIFYKVLPFIPRRANIFISNSMPVRDFDFFSPKIKADFKIFTNRGASGIDGIISTATGIAINSKLPTYLIIGDLAFYHNINALSTLDELNCSLKIILLNNFGGGIFEMLPISKKNRYFDKYFKTSHNINIKSIVKSYNGYYTNPKSWKKFKSEIVKTKSIDRFSVIEINTNSKKSVDIRNSYIQEAKKVVKNINVL